MSNANLNFIDHLIVVLCRWWQSRQAQLRYDNDVVPKINDFTMDDIDDARRDATRERNRQASRRQGLRVELVQGEDGSHAW